MAEQQARIAFIGAGAFATQCIYPCIPLVAAADLVAVCDIEREKAELNARNFGARRVYTNLEEMLDREQPDGVFCIGTAPQQYQLAPHVLRRGIPVYVEKPSANTSVQARELAEMAEAHQTWGQVGFMKRFADVYRIAQEIVHRPEFGALHEVKAKFAQGPYPQLWGIDSPKRSMLIGQLCHIFDLVRFFGGDVRQVSAMYHEATPTQFAYAATLRFASGALGILDLNSLECKEAFRDIYEELQLVGLESNLTCRDMRTLDWLSPTDWSTLIPATGRFVHSLQPSWTGTTFNKRSYGYLGEVEHFVRKVIDLAEGGPDLWDSYKALQLGEAVYDSAESGSMVTIEDC